MLVVLGVELDEHRIGTCGEVALHNLRNREQTVDHVAVHRPSLQVHSDIGAGGVAQRLGIDLKTAARDDSILYEMLHTLVDSCSRNAALCSHVLERKAGIGGQDSENLFV